MVVVVVVVVVLVVVVVWVAVVVVVVVVVVVMVLVVFPAVLFSWGDGRGDKLNEEDTTARPWHSREVPHFPFNKLIYYRFMQYTHW